MERLHRLLLTLVSSALEVCNKDRLHSQPPLWPPISRPHKYPRNRSQSHAGVETIRVHWTAPGSRRDYSTTFNMAGYQDILPCFHVYFIIFLLLALLGNPECCVQRMHYLRLSSPPRRSVTPTRLATAALAIRCSALVRVLAVIALVASHRHAESIRVDGKKDKGLGLATLREYRRLDLKHRRPPCPSRSDLDSNRQGAGCLLGIVFPPFSL